MTEGKYSFLRIVLTAAFVVGDGRMVVVVVRRCVVRGAEVVDLMVTDGLS